eukprot:jgi/Psemu1/41780/gm1.41780_g
MDSNNKNNGKSPINKDGSPGNTGGNHQQVSKNSQPGQKGKPEAGTKKFQGHDQQKEDMKGIILRGDANAQDYYKVFKEHQATLGGSKHVPDIGIGEDKTGKPIYEPDPIKKKVAEQMQEEELKIKVKQYTTYCSDIQKVFAVAYGQLYDKMKDKLWSNGNSDKLESSRCVVKPLEMLRDICYQGSKTKVNPETNLLRAFRKLVCCRQRPGNRSEYSKSVTADAFELFKKSLGGSSITYKKTITHELKQGSHQISTYVEYLDLPDDDAKKIAIVAGANTLKETLANQYSLGTNQYPQITSQTNGHNPTTVEPTNQSSQPSPTRASSSNLIPRIICTAIFLTPPDLAATSISNLKHPQTNVKPTNAGPASMDVHSQNRSDANNKSMTIHYNSGSAKTNQVADLPRFGVVWLYKDGIANTLSLALLTNQF